MLNTVPHFILKTTLTQDKHYSQYQQREFTHQQKLWTRTSTHISQNLNFVSTLEEIHWLTREQILFKYIFLSYGFQATEQPWIIYESYIMMVPPKLKTVKKKKKKKEKAVQGMIGE